MKKQSPVGLIIEGNATNSAILRLPGVAEEIGPIKSTALRVARRVSNMLRAGYAVADYEQLEATRLILVRAPDGALPRIIDELLAADLDFRSLCFVLCESWIHSNVFDPLRKKGACGATILAVPSAARNWFVSEGDYRVLRALRVLVERADGKTLELRNGRKEFYFAAELLASALPIPMYVAAQRALREAGLSGKHLQILLEEMAERMFRDFVHASRITWGGPLTECASDVADLHLKLLRDADKALAEVVADGLQFGRRHMPASIRQR
jgi:predicted short-subunit dehydrogenase-like oxidoreductase (DUF2520 family)